MKKAVAGPVEYVERAVVEKRFLPIERTFANTMLGNHFTTPGNNPLRIKEWKGKMVLTESGRELFVDEGDIDRASFSEQSTSRICLGCVQCRCIIGSKATMVSCANHPLRIGTIQVGANDQSSTVKVKINVCQARHAWIDGPTCPDPDCRLSANKKQEIEFHCPTDTSYDDISWAST